MADYEPLSECKHTYIASGFGGSRPLPYCMECKEPAKAIIASLQTELASAEKMRDTHDEAAGKLARRVNQLLAEQRKLQAELEELRNRPYVPQMVTPEPVETITITDGVAPFFVLPLAGKE